MAVGGKNKKFVSLACINIIIAANAGGAFSPFGDITTLMVWQKGKVQFGEFFLIFIPSVINWLVPAIIMSVFVERQVPEVSDETVTMKFGAHRIMVLFLLTIATAVSFHNFLHLPPAAGMMLGLGYLGAFSYYIKIREGREDRYDSILGQRAHEALHPLTTLIQRRTNLSDFIQEYSEPTFMIDDDHIVRHWNRAMEKLSGVSASEVIGTRRHWHPFYEKERLVLADLVLENFSKDEIGRHYGGHHKQVHSIDHAYETAAFFPTLGKEGK
jgi:PAS domain-containing protein